MSVRYTYLKEVMARGLTQLLTRTIGQKGRTGMGNIFRMVERVEGNPLFLRG